MNKYIKILILLISMFLFMFLNNCEPTFEEFTFKLSIEICPENSGEVIVSPEKSIYNGNEEVTLTASPKEAYLFIGWEGDIASQEPQITIIMNSDKSIIAVFKEIEYSDIVVKQEDNIIVNGANPGYDFGNVDAGISSKTVTFTIESIGNLPLTINSISLAGDNTDQFIIDDTQLTTPIATGNNSSFKITFEPSSQGDKYATILIGNDSDKNPFSFVIKGTAIGHKFIKVSQNGNYIPNNSSPGYDFGSLLTGMSSIRTYFTIKNIGTDSLTINNLIFETDNTFSFLFYNDLSSNFLLPGEEATFSIKFRGYSVGNKIGTVTIESESENNPYIFTVIGTVTDDTESEINLKVGDKFINDGDDPGYTFDDVYVTYSSEEITFTIGSFGTAPLPIYSVKITTGDVDQFMIDTSTIVSPIMEGETTYFTITFNPTSIGVKHAIVSISNTDEDENPFVFGIMGEGKRIPEPEILIKQGENEIINGSNPAYEFGEIELSYSSDEIIFTIKNIGIDPLEITSVNLIGENVEHFTIIDDMILSIVPINESTSFGIIFNPSSVGIKTVTVSIENNDLNENPFTFTITGNAVAYPGINIKQNDTVIANGSDPGYDFKTIGLGFSSSSVIFTIESIGTAPLEINDISLTSGDIDQFIIDDSFTLTTVPSGNKTKFAIIFKPIDSGEKSAVVTIQNNDSNKNPLTFTIKGTTEFLNYDYISFPGYAGDVVNWEEYVKSFIGDDDLQWFDENGDKNYIPLMEKARIWVTFVMEEAGYKNRLGYYIYDTPPTSENQINAEEKITLFNNTSAEGSGGYLNAGDTIYLGEYNPAEKGNIALWLHQNGYNYPNKPYWYPFDEGVFGQDNTQLNKDSKRHIIMFVDKDEHEAGEKAYLIFSFEDLTNLGDRDFDDVVIIVTIEPIDPNLCFEDIVDISNMITIDELREYLQIPE